MTGHTSDAIASQSQLTKSNPADHQAWINLATLLAYPSFYHLRPVVVVGNVKQEDSGEIRLSVVRIDLACHAPTAHPDDGHLPLKNTG